MLISYKNGQGSIVLRIKIRNSSVTTGAGLTGLTSASTGLIISAIADTEATATTYTVAGSTIESITTLGTYAAPTATKCRFKEVDATNHPGVYEIQLADARFAVSNAKSLLVSVTGATNAADCDVLVPLPTVDPYVSGGNAPISSNVKKNTSLAAFPFRMVLSSDHVSAATGKTITATRSLDGGAFGACANAAAEVANGVYAITLAATDLNANTVFLYFTATGCDPTPICLVTQP